MKNILKHLLAISLSAMLIAACSDWTEVESIGINETMPWEKNPAEWAEYHARVRDYKSRHINRRISALITLRMAFKMRKVV